MNLLIYYNNKIVNNIYIINIKFNIIQKMMIILFKKLYYFKIIINKIIIF